MNLNGIFSWRNNEETNKSYKYVETVLQRTGFCCACQFFCQYKHTSIIIS